MWRWRCNKCSTYSKPETEVCIVKPRGRAYKADSCSTYKDVSASRKSRTSNPLATELEIRGFSSPDAVPAAPLTATLGASFNPAAVIIATTCLHHSNYSSHNGLGAIGYFRLSRSVNVIFVQRQKRCCHTPVA